MFYSIISFTDLPKSIQAEVRKEDFDTVYAKKSKTTKKVVGYVLSFVAGGLTYFNTKGICLD